MKAWLIALLLVFSPVAAGSEGEPPKLSPSVQIGLKDGETVDYFCTAFHIGDRFIVTAGHCTDNKPTGTLFLVKLEDGTTATAMSIVSSIAGPWVDDLAVLRLTAPAVANWAEAKIDCGPEKPSGYMIRGEGYPDMVPNLITSIGYIGGHTVVDESFKVFPLYVAGGLISIPGASGSPIYGQDSNKVIALLTGYKLSATLLTPIAGICTMLHLKD